MSAAVVWYMARPLWVRVLLALPIVALVVLVLAWRETAGRVLRRGGTLQRVRDTAADIEADAIAAPGDDARADAIVDAAEASAEAAERARVLREVSAARESGNPVLPDPDAYQEEPPAWDGVVRRW